MVFITALKNEKNLKVFTTDHRPITKLLRTKMANNHFICSNPNKSPKKFSQEIQEIVKKNDIDFLIPINSNEIRILLKDKEKFGKSLAYMGEYETFLSLDNKKNLANLIEPININKPKTYSSVEEINKYPIVFKPTESSSSKGVEYFYDAESLRKHISNQPNQKFILQEFIQGEGVGFSVLAKEGQVLYSCGHKRIAEYPISGGSSTVRGYFNHTDMEDTAEKVIAHTNWSGFAMFEFKFTPANKVFLIEINPRIWGSINQSIATGVNFPKLLANSRMPNPLPQEMIKINPETITYISPLCWLSVFGYIFKQCNFRAPWQFLKNYFNAKPDISFLRDPLGFLSLFSRFIN